MAVSTVVKRTTGLHGGNTSPFLFVTPVLASVLPRKQPAFCGPPAARSSFSALMAACVSGAASIHGAETPRLGCSPNGSAPPIAVSHVLDLFQSLGVCHSRISFSAGGQPQWYQIPGSDAGLPLERLEEVGAHRRALPGVFQRLSDPGHAAGARHSAHLRHRLPAESGTLSRLRGEGRSSRR